MIIGTENGPIETLYAIKKIAVDEIVPDKIKWKCGQHGKHGSSPAFAHGLPG
jgi:hypothetical protein